MVRQALEQGHCLTVFAQTPRSPENLDLEVVSKLVQGQDAVVIGLGTGSQAGDQTRSQGTAHICGPCSSRGSGGWSR